MDVSKEYIEMCRKATKIQEWWHNNPHTISEWARSYFVSPKDDSLIHYYDFDAYPQHSIAYTWLPFQDQLQGMVIGNYYPKYSMSAQLDEMMALFYNFCFSGKTTQEWPWNKPNVSMEQLWLVFVMHEKYDKRWDGKGWY